MDHEELYIGGAWIQSSSSERIAVENPTTQEVIGHVPAGDAQDVERAVAAAWAALPGRSARLPAERAVSLRKLHTSLSSRQDELARIISTEMGAPARIASRIQAQLPISVIAGYADMVTEHPFEQQVVNSLVVHEPIGVVAAITPWN